MSGFAGFLTFPDPLPDPASALARIVPDAPDALVLADGCVGLVGSRLGCAPGGGLAVAFDGTIHNRAALRAELAAAGTPPSTDRDEDLILALHARHGAACVERLRGPFALALWDGGTYLLVRDPAGLRSLYYHHDEPGGRLVFATGVRPLLASGLVPKQLDARGLYGYFRHGAVPEGLSLVEGVRLPEPGERLLWKAGQITRDRFRAPPFPAATSLRAALLDSVGEHLADGVPAGVFVGGGSGSAALLALAREAGREKNLRALTIGFDDAALDESAAARRVAEHFGVPHTHLRLDRDRARAWFDDFLPTLDQPGVHGFPLFALCRFAREEGVAVALAGLGSGALFGDPRLRAQLERLMGWSRRLGSRRGAVGRFLLGRVRRPAWRRRADFLTRPPTLAGAYAAIRGIHTAEEARALVARFADPTGCADLSATDDEIGTLELRRLRGQLLRDASVFSRAQGLELRLPFVDQRVTDTLARLAGGQTLRGAVPEIPAWAGAKPGEGLRFPLESWRADNWVADKPADAPGRRAWEQKWSLSLFRNWRRRFIAG